MKTPQNTSAALHRPRRTTFAAGGLLGALVMSASVLLVPARATAAVGTPGVDWSAAASLPPIPGPDSGGPTLARDAVVDLSCIGDDNCVSATERPTLHAAGDPDEDGEYRYMVFDLSGTGGATELVAEHKGPEASWVVPADRLQHGHTYAWRIIGSADTPQSWNQFIVDLRRSADQPLDDLGPLTVGLGTGALMMSRAVPTGGAALALGFADPGPHTASMLPTGWSIGGEAIADIDLVRVESFADGATVVVHALDGTAVRYERDDEADGAYVPPSLDGADVSFAYPTLTATANGWQATDGTGRVSTFGPNGNLIAVDASAQDGYARTEYDVVADGGRLLAVTDRTTGRTMTFTYRGDRSCRPPAGFDGGAGDQALLCTITGFDGTETSLGYLDGRLARIEAAGATTDVVYDGAGRVVELREPIAADAVAAGVRPDDASVRWSIGYDDQGRVAHVATPEPTPGAAEITRSYQYGSGTTTVHVIDDGGERVALTVEFDSDDARPTLQRNAAGATTQYLYGPDGALLGTIDPQGQQTTYHHDPATSTATLYGPAPAAWFGDDGVPLPAHADAVATQVQSNGAGAGAHATFSSANSMEAVRLITGPHIEAPASIDTSTDWRTTLSADPAVNAGDQLRISASGVDAAASTVIVNGTACALGEGCPIDEVGSTNRSMLIADLHVAAGTSAIDATIQRSTDGGATWADVPFDSFSGNDLPTTTTHNDVYRSGTAAVTTVEDTVYADPAAGIVDRYLRDGQATATLRHEALDPAADQWGRPTAIVRPSGLTTTLDYWGSTASATHPLTGESLAQTGQRKNIQIGNGAVYTTIYDGAGNPVATLIDGTVVEAVVYDARGRMERLVTPSGTSEVIYGANGDPLRTDVASSLSTGDVFVSTTTDLLGRTIEQTDVWGVTSQLSYDRTGNLVSVVTTTPDLSTTTRTYTWDAAGIAEDRVVAVDGSVVWARITERDHAGDATAIEYSNGTTVRLAIDPATGVESATWTDAAGGVWSETITSSTQADRTLSQVLSTPTSTATFGFGYDPSSGALIDATLEVIGDGAMSADWTYSSTYPNGDCGAAHMLADGARGTAVATIDGVTTTTTTCYDADGAAAGQNRTTDGVTEPVRVEVNSGNVVAYDEVEMAYDATGQLVAANDGETILEFTRGTDSEILERRTTTVDTGTMITRTASAGLTLDEHNDPMLQSIEFPGGAAVTIPLGDAAGWSFLNAGGDVWFTTNAAGIAEATVAILYSPDGELLTTDTADAAWKQGNNGDSLGLATELVIFGARVYAPGLASFTTADPLAHGGSTPYNYANGDPINLVDPTGNAPEWVTKFANFLDSVPPWAEFVVVLVVILVAFIPVVGPALAAAMSLVLAGYYIYKGVTAILDGDIAAGILYLTEAVVMLVSFGYLAKSAAAGKGMMTTKTSVVGRNHVVPQKKWKGVWKTRNSRVKTANVHRNPRTSVSNHADNLYRNEPTPIRSQSSQTISAPHSFHPRVVTTTKFRTGALVMIFANVPILGMNLVAATNQGPNSGGGS